LSSSLRPADFAEERKLNSSISEEDDDVLRIRRPFADASKPVENRLLLDPGALVTWCVQR